jgi:hypothetical protein
MQVAVTFGDVSRDKAELTKQHDSAKLSVNMNEFMGF